MSVESLRDMSYSTKSDIWECGVAIYEIFTLGALPYSGLSWTPDFVNYLTRGLRMNKPPFATNNLYKLLLECWDNDPSQRPNVTTLCGYFNEILQSHNILLNDVNEMIAGAEDNISTDSSQVPSPVGSC
jgi:serine/threonine protein kinase